MSFRLKTVFGIALIEVVVMAILISINQFGLGGSAATQLYERAQSTNRVFMNAVSDAVVSTDLATLDATIATAVASEELRYLRILDSQGRVLAQGGSPTALSAIFVADGSFDEATSDHIIDLEQRIVISGNDFGAVQVGLSTEAVEQEIAAALQWNIIVALIGMSLVAVFGFGLGSVLTAQLKDLSDGANRITKGDLDFQITVKGRDELAETAKCFNTMAQTLLHDRMLLIEKQKVLVAKKERVEVLVECLADIANENTGRCIPDTERDDEIGRMARATAVFRDTMEALQNAHLKQQRLLTAFDQVEEQVAIFDTDGRVIFTNRTFRILNAEILEPLPADFTQEQFLREGCNQEAFLFTGQTVDEWVASQMRREFGTPREIKLAPDRVWLTLQSNVPNIGVVFSAKDITELRHSEHQLVQAAKLATLGEMATGIAHELNQPLGVIRMAAKNSIKRIDRGKGDPEYLRGKLVRMEEQTERAAQIINHMRIFGREAEGVLEPFNLRDALLSVSTLARTQLHTLDISLRLDIPENDAYVIGEQIIFEQVLLNLISNARDAIESTGRKDGTINLAAQFDDVSGHVVELTDTGGGIPESVLDKIFQPFFTTKDPGKGTGLGLSISFGTIQDMNGDIQVTNTGSGARFSIALPPCEMETQLSA